MKSFENFNGDDTEKNVNMFDGEEIADSVAKNMQDLPVEKSGDNPKHNPGEDLNEIAQSGIGGSESFVNLDEQKSESDLAEEIASEQQEESVGVVEAEENSAEVQHADEKQNGSSKKQSNGRESFVNYESMLTTVDNPFDPFEKFDDWFRFDEEKGYHSCGYLGRIAEVDDEMSDEEVQKEIERAIDEIIKYDFMNIYKKVRRPISSDEN